MKNAEYLYNHVMDFPNDKLSNRCCNFPLLEKAMVEYITGQQEAAASLDNT